jgi:hypothetical protein
MKTILITLITTIFFISSSLASSIKASSFGFTSTDATIAFQTALNSSFDTIIIDLQTSNWIVKPTTVFDINNKVIIIEKNVIVKAKVGEYNDPNDCLLSLVRCKFITLIGYGAEFIMNRAEYAQLPDSAIGGWRMGLGISNCKNIQVYGLKISDSGGDGVFISGDTWYANTQNPDLFSENILIKDVWSNHNYRQGISVVSVQNLLVQNSWFTNTQGTLPMAGVDIEPDNNGHRIVNVVFDKCRFTNNSGSGISVALSFQDTSATPVDVTFKNCYSAQNHDASNPYYATEILIASKQNNGVLGNVKFDKCMVENSKWTAVSIHKTENSFSTEFNNCVFNDVSKDSTVFFNNPIFIEVTDYVNNVPRFGGVTFNNCLLRYSSPIKCLGSYGNIATCAGMGSVFFNNVTVVNTNTTLGYDATTGGGSPLNCTFNFNALASSTPALINFISNNTIIECSNISSYLNFTTNSTLNYPLGITYTITGSGEQGYDYNLMNGFNIVAVGATMAADTMAVIINQEQEPNKTDVVNIVTNSSYIASSNNQSIIISDCTLTLSTTEFNSNSNNLSVSPNPATSNVLLNYYLPTESEVNMYLYDVCGKNILSSKLNKQSAGYSTFVVNLNTVSSGTYIAKLVAANHVFTAKIIVK